MYEQKSPCSKNKKTVRNQYNKIFSKPLCLNFRLNGVHACYILKASIGKP